MFNERQTGRSTEQMRTAPKGAIYIWPNTQSRNYATSLAKSVNRDDLRIETPDFFDRHGWRGQRTPVILDHATWGFMTDSQKHECVQMDGYLAAVLP